MVRLIKTDSVLGILIFLSCASFSAGIYFLKNHSKLAERIQAVSHKNLAGNKAVFSNISTFIIQLAGKFGFNTDLSKFDRKLFLAGRPFSMTAEEFVGAWVAMVAAAVVVVGTLIISGSLTPFFGIFLVFLLAVLPRVIVHSAAETGTARLSSEVIDLIMQLELGVYAGLTTARVLEWAAESPTKLGNLLKLLHKEISMGEKTYVIFSRLADDYGIAEAREVAMALKQADVQGVEIGVTLSGLSRDLRDTREREAEIRVGRLEPSISSILTLTIMVAALSLYVGPIVAETLPLLDQMFAVGY